MKYILLLLTFFSCLQITHAGNDLITAQPSYSSTTLAALALTHAFDASIDPLKEEASTPAFVLVNTCKSGCFILASDIISTAVSKRYCENNPEVRQTCLLITDWALLAACHECDKRCYPFPKKTKTKQQ